MSLCARGALSRALRLDSLRYGSRACSLRLPTTIYSRCRAATFTLNSSTINQGHNQCRKFTTSRPQKAEADTENLIHVLPTCCPGCGAFSQTIEPNEPGYYSSSRKQTRKLLASKRETIEQSDTAEDATRAVTEDSGLGMNAQPTAPIPIQGRFRNMPSFSMLRGSYLPISKVAPFQMMSLYPTTTHYDPHREALTSAIAATT